MGGSTYTIGSTHRPLPRVDRRAGARWGVKYNRIGRSGPAATCKPEARSGESSCSRSGLRAVYEELEENEKPAFRRASILTQLACTAIDESRVEDVTPFEAFEKSDIHEVLAACAELRPSVDIAVVPPRG